MRNRRRRIPVQTSQDYNPEELTFFIQTPTSDTEYLWLVVLMGMTAVPVGSGAVLSVAHILIHSASQHLYYVGNTIILTVKMKKLRHREV